MLLSTYSILHWIKQIFTIHPLCFVNFWQSPTFLESVSHSLKFWSDSSGSEKPTLLYDTPCSTDQISTCAFILIYSAKYPQFPYYLPKLGQKLQFFIHCGVEIPENRQFLDILPKVDLALRTWSQKKTLSGGKYRPCSTDQGLRKPPCSAAHTQ